MATNNPKTADSRISVTSFGGIADHAGLTTVAAADVRNFRILSDGTLEKRCGYLRRHNFSKPLRGLWEGVVSGMSMIFAVAGNTVYLWISADDSPNAIYTMSTSEGEVNFFLYRDRLWLMDGTSLLLFRPANMSFSIAEGYVPLYGYNWHPTSLGEINEPLNLLRNEIRIHYFNSNGSTTFQLPFTTQKINYIRVNGTTVTSYSFKSGTSTFTIPSGYSTVGSVEVYATLDPTFSGRTSVLAASCPKVFRTPEREVMMCHGAKAGYLIYRTAPVSDEMLSSCSLTIADADPMYIAKDTAFAVGSSSHPVTSLCQFEDQMLVFNDESLWAIRYPEKDSDDAEILPIRSGLGCTSRRGVTLCGKYPIAATAAGITRLKFSASDTDFCQPEILSTGIREKFGKEFLENAILFWDEFRQELWVRDPSDSVGNVWICDPEREIWVRFDRIPAKQFFRFGGALSFADSNGIYYFDEEEMTDNGKIISAEYLSHFLDLTSPKDAPKRSIRLCAVSQNDEDSLSTRIETERGDYTIKLRSGAPPTDKPVHFSRRMSMGRFRFLKYLITSVGQSRCRIYSYSITANP